ncbi:GIY-YIG nuclease family protein [Catalinimonas niigatensis]|uniref:GIY-YIG nuclease family protein n=1 Tax=Catalinimonas niigatensis TaxID=1397264 RepID=UPI0026666B66|nr:GIY-YIG nuclease family protein [Catalinimonas niigatensis]WPP53652.1 GIY-YIG nuclease family protein [Catalinimonas niigatensis]
MTTNPAKTVLYVGMTNDLYRRMIEHYENRGKQKTFAGKYYCYKLIYYERFSSVKDAIDREKELKGWRREKKIALIEQLNSHWSFLNENLKGD